MTNPEAKVKVKVKTLLLEQQEMYFNMPVPSGYGAPMLDFVGCHRGAFFAIETKAPGEHLTPRQNLTKEQMEQAGGKVFVIGVEVLTNDEQNLWWYSGMRELRQWLHRPR